MVEHLEIVNAAVSLLIKAALLAARFSGWERRRSLKRLTAMDVDARAKEVLFRKDRAYRQYASAQDSGRTELVTLL